MVICSYSLRGGVGGAVSWENFSFFPPMGFGPAVPEGYIPDLGTYWLSSATFQ